jgi:hypothetical protein
MLTIKITKPAVLAKSAKGHAYYKQTGQVLYKSRVDGLDEEIPRIFAFSAPVAYQPGTYVFDDRTFVPGDYDGMEIGFVYLNPSHTGAGSAPAAK